jgi:hypothetical protein
MELEHIPPFGDSSSRHSNSTYQSDLFEALRILMLSRWWNRVWVVQEIVVSKNITLLYGSMTAPWDMFVKAALAYSQNLYSPALSSVPYEYTKVLEFFSRIVLDIRHMRDRWRNGEKTTLLPLLRRFSDRKATDDRDKVYALLGLVGDPSSIVPDYSHDATTVFKNTALGIIETTKSLGVLMGDLGRKNRQDLPSWVPDWSAAYDDLDRRRAEDTDNYNATAGSVVYAGCQGDGELGGIRRYMERLRLEFNRNTNLGLEEFSRPEDYSKVLGTSEWTKYGINPGVTFNQMCLESIANYYIVRGGPIWLRDYGVILRTPGLRIDIVAVTGDVCFSNEDLSSVVPAWATLVAQFSNGDPYGRTGGLGEAFLRTLCADTIHPDVHAGGPGYRHITDCDLVNIARWAENVLKSSRHRASADVCMRLFCDIITPASSNPPDLNFDLYASIKTAIMRRRFFITQMGYIGLGPAGVQPGDELYLLLGGRAPFVLRQSGFHSVPIIPDRPGIGSVRRLGHKVIGDCYVHGLMDGEAMQAWNKNARAWLDESKELFSKYSTYYLEYEKLSKLEVELRGKARAQQEADEWREKVRAQQEASELRWKARGQQEADELREIARGEQKADELRKKSRTEQKADELRRIYAEFQSVDQRATRKRELEKRLQAKEAEVAVREWELEKTLQVKEAEEAEEAVRKRELENRLQVTKYKQDKIAQEINKIISFNEGKRQDKIYVYLI